MTETTLREMFVHNLEDIYYAENELLDALDELAEQTNDADVAAAFRDHRAETEGHIDRLDKVFEMLGEDPSEEECEGIDGLIAEHEQFVEMNPNPEVLDVHNLIAGQKTEHYEIAVYGNLALLADRLGESDVGDLLHDTLEEEKEALDTLSGLTDEFDYDVVMQSGAAD
jgi:ferritin-like metal-binding protein YciE